ncbi:hypothetical protein [Synechococcus sp. CS-1328]|uniref:hypothetical protein n=1 Tax=Synechococcus sp. CS-1328 TaxID=2847976 RepID=UPI00223BD107|nr:hypothetical protein [Synechococcus sp. CS-1328]MCT0224004.1 hypothetical protein [Synechococcus sp. CS-1328]
MTPPLKHQHSNPKNSAFDKAWRDRIGCFHAGKIRDSLDESKQSTEHLLEVEGTMKSCYWQWKASSIDGLNQEAAKSS